MSREQPTTVIEWCDCDDPAGWHTHENDRPRQQDASALRTALERLLNVGDALWEDRPPVWMSEADDARAALAALPPSAPPAFGAVKDAGDGHGAVVVDPPSARLPAYEAAVEALEAVLGATTFPEEADAKRTARAALSRLRPSWAGHARLDRDR